MIDRFVLGRFRKDKEANELLSVFSSSHALDNISAYGFRRPPNLRTHFVQLKFRQGHTHSMNGNRLIPGQLPNSEFTIIHEARFENNKIPRNSYPNNTVSKIETPMRNPKPLINKIDALSTTKGHSYRERQRTPTRTQ